LNEFLRSELNNLLDTIHAEAEKNAIYPVSRKENASRRSNLDRDSMLKELEQVNARIAKLTEELKKYHQESWIRSVEDNMRLKRKELNNVNSELESLRATAVRQGKVFDELNKSNQFIANLRNDLMTEKRFHQQLRKEATRLKIKPL